MIDSDDLATGASGIEQAGLTVDDQPGDGERWPRFGELDAHFLGQRARMQTTQGTRISDIQPFTNDVEGYGTHIGDVAKHRARRFRANDSAHDEQFIARTATTIH